MTQQLTILFTSDTHGQWLERPDQPGQTLFNTAAAIRQLQQAARDRGSRVLTLDLGDFMQGAMFASYLNQAEGDGSVLARAMNALDYDYQLYGNHEFNFGPVYRESIMSQLQAQILAANILDEEGQVAYGQAYDIVELDGLRVGIIGLTTQYIPNWELPANIEGLTFEDPVQTLLRYVPELRPQVDLLVVAYHGGYERDLETLEATESLTGENQGIELLEAYPEIDVLLTGHQHRRECQSVLGRPTLQPGYAGEYIGQLIINHQDGQIQTIQSELVPTATYPADTQVMAVMEPELSRGREWLETVLGHAPIQSPTDDVQAARLHGHPFIELVNQVQLHETGADFSAMAIPNENFKFFTGDVTRQDLLLAYPFYNLVAKVTVTGQELREILEFDLNYLVLDDQGQIQVNPTYIAPKPQHYNWDYYSGVKVTADLTRPVGNRIVELLDQRSGQPIVPDQAYTLALSQDRAVGGGDYRWFRERPIDSLSSRDIASMLTEALGSFTPADWQRVNQDYQHFFFVNEVAQG